jgi:hypothetical protein
MNFATRLHPDEADGSVHFVPRETSRLPDLRYRCRTRPASVLDSGSLSTQLPPQVAAARPPCGGLTLPQGHPYGRYRAPDAGCRSAG